MPYSRAAFILVLAITPGAIAQKNSGQIASIEAALRGGRAAVALHLAQRAAHDFPRDERFPVLEAVAFQKLGDSSSALQQFERALAIAPDSVAALEGAAELEYQKQSPRAIPLLDRLLVLHPSDLMAHAMLAASEYRQGNCQAAAPHFQKALTLVSTQPSALEEYGDCLLRMKQPDRAIPAFQRYLEMNPEQGEARYNLAVAQFMAHRLPAAQATLRPLLDASNPPAFVLSLGADLAEASGNTPDAVRYLRRAILSRPDSVDNYVRFATLCFDHASYETGVTMLNAGLKRNPKAAPLYLARGILLVQMGKYDQGESDFAMADRLDPHQSFGSVGQGLAEFQSDHLGKALSSVRSQLRRHPENPYLHYLLAAILVQKGAAARTAQYREAESSARQALKLQPNFPLVRDLLADLYLHSNRVADAIRQCRLALQSDPSDTAALYHLVLALRKSNRKEEIPSLLKRLAAAREAQGERGESLRRYHLVIEHGPSGRP